MCEKMIEPKSSNFERLKLTVHSIPFIDITGIKYFFYNIKSLFEYSFLFK